uniref:Uncharacterized protein n=1 Tax=Anguilla anguilla TaxID=7936 RepID=A0A0E9SAS4_ANGAN
MGDTSDPEKVVEFAVEALGGAGLPGAEPHWTQPIRNVGP